MCRASVITVAALVLAACSSDSPTSPAGSNAPKTATVEASAVANAFAPPTVTIARGGTVTWTFGARPHTVTFAAAAGAPADVPRTTNDRAARTFDAAGTFNYECTIHSGMNGTVVVE